MTEVRLNKYLAECGICSRRQGDELIRQGNVKVNGMSAVNGQKVAQTDRIEVNGTLLKGALEKVVLKYYKPVGVTCTEKDKHAKYKITDVINYPIRVTYAGRLDKDSEGLLLLTNDGELINRMMRGANGHEKEYVVKVKQEVKQEFLTKMSQGIYLKELDITTRKCQIEQVGEFAFRIILTQGVNRQIRRMCNELGYDVVTLKRIRVMNITLDNLKSGEYVEITGSELNKLYQDAGE